MGRPQLEWDELKAKRNWRKHGVSFEEAGAIFLDPFAITRSDPDHSADELRFVDIGVSAQGRLLVVVYTERAEYIRIISARRATATERRIYEEEAS